MYVRGSGVEYAEIVKIINAVSADKYSDNIRVHQDAAPIGKGGYGYRGRIIGQASSGEGVRTSASGRRGPWACWHAYGHVMLSILTTYPHAVISTSMARYEGLADFLTTYPHTAEHNIGSMANPLCVADACKCESDDLD
jgi:hypothetical protein